MTAVRPVPGLGIIVLNNKTQILMGKRKDTGLFGMPGGYLEKFESWEQGAARELKEETDINVDPEKIYTLQVFNALEKSKNYHNVAIILTCEFPDGQEVKNMEPDKCTGWEWWDLGSLETRIEEIFYPNRQLIREYKHLIDPEYLKKIISDPPKLKSTFYK